VNVPSPPEHDAELEVDSPYLAAALDHMAALGIGLAIATWVVIEPSSQDRASMLLYDMASRLKIAERWRPLLALCRIATKPKMKESLRVRFQANAWLATRELDGLAAIQDALEEWDVSALSREFQLIRHCLLEDYEAAAELVPEMVEGKELDQRGIASNPLFRPLLEQPIVQNLTKESPSANDER
jgi:hypothetical protein